MMNKHIISLHLWKVWITPCPCFTISQPLSTETIGIGNIDLSMRVSMLMMTMSLCSPLKTMLQVPLVYPMLVYCMNPCRSGSVTSWWHLNVFTSGQSGRLLIRPDTKTSGHCYRDDWQALSNQKAEEFSTQVGKIDKPWYLARRRDQSCGSNFNIVDWVLIDELIFFCFSLNWWQDVA